ncbi:Kelch repeat-containing protein [Haliea sp. E17]|uniref:Kelch repeat-containing protein n=1 Tax=Haliea sp. E17 TaxID=3401576 RepID=UPI003AAD6E3A
MQRRQFLQGVALAGLGVQWAPAPLFAATSPAHWEEATDLLFAVQEIYPALHESAIHSAGGIVAVREGRVVPTDRHVRYDLNQARWSESAPLPAARHHISLASSDGALFGLGGFAASPAGNWSMHAQTWRYVSADARWEQVAAAPEAHAETVTLANDGVIHVIGGRVPGGQGNAAWADHRDSRRHLAYDVRADKWETRSPAPTGRNSAAGAVIDGLVYVVGGRTVAGPNLSLLEIYDPAADRWYTGAPLPQAQGGLAAAALDGRLVAFGGEYFGAAGQGVHAQAWLYSPAEDRWSPLPPMPRPRHGLGAVSAGGLVFALGGATSVGAAGTSAAMDTLALARA